MTDTAKRLVGPVMLTASGVALYTVPAATTTIVRSIHVTGVANSLSTTFNMGVGTTSTPTTTNAIFWLTPVPYYGVLDWSGFLVLNAGDILSGLASAVNYATVTVSGVEVS